MAGGREERRVQKGDVTSVTCVRTEQGGRSVAVPRRASDGVVVEDPKNPKLGRRNKREKHELKFGRETRVNAVS